MTNLSL